MIFVDSSVWINFFRGTSTPQVALLDSLLGQDLLVVGDLVVAEVLRGFRSQLDFHRARKTLEAFTIVDVGGQAIAVQSAKNFRTLRAMGITIRKTIDSLIATRCIKSGYALLHDDKDFDPFEQHLGLRVVRA